MEKITSLNLFKVFLKIGLILLGGGYVILPIMEESLVIKRKWLTKDELVDFYCIAQSLPGIVAINTSILTGCKLLKFKGALIAVLGLSISPVISIIVIANFISYIIKIPFVESIFWGVNIAVIILIYLALKEMWQKSIQDMFCFFWFLFILALALLKVNPAILIIFSILIGFILQKIKGKNND